MTTLPRSFDVLLPALRDALTASKCALQVGGMPPLGPAEARATLAVADLDRVTAALREPGYQSLGEAYLAGAIDVIGDFEAACEFALRLRERLGLAEDQEPAPRLDDPTGPPGLDSAFSSDAPVHERARDAAAIAYHYDLSNRVFALITDDSMMYSCAYFHGPDDELGLAQRQKLDRVCRKLDLQPGERLLDIGCGWGGLLIHAVRNYDVDAVGVTISAAQAEEARARIAAAGLADRCEVRLCDYREIVGDQGFDKIASLGMVEHVGVARLPRYFEVARAALRPGGRFLLQGVSSARHMPRTEALDWAQHYIFPDADLPYLSQYVEAGTRAALELRDVECMREHYALTHRHWRHNLERAREQVVAEVGEERYRAMRAMFGFSTYHMLVGRRCEVYQMLFHRPVAGQVFGWRRPV